ncbi:MAG: endonuclease/exonuclease/phosphatase family protein [Pseudomonadota bacterium]
MANTYNVAFWNVENLFAPDGHPTRIDWMARRLANQLKGWSPAIFERKISQLAKVIAAMNGGQGPDLLGLCEVENRFVLDTLVAAVSGLLPGRDYRVVHADSERDRRGIDTAFLFDHNRIAVNANEVFSHFVMRRTGTRDILQATFTTTTGNEFIALANHWPSRRGGAHLSAGFRQTAGETLGYWHERIREEKNDKRYPVIALGDFNDEPFDPSMTVNARATRVRSLVTRGTSARFLNLSWAYRDQRVDTTGRSRIVSGTLYYEGEPNLFDQILVSKGFLLEDSPITCDVRSARLDTIPEMVSRKSSEGPIRFGFPRKGQTDGYINLDGFSDHFPISLTLKEAS